MENSQFWTPNGKDNNGVKKGNNSMSKVMNKVKPVGNKSVLKSRIAKILGGLFIFAFVIFLILYVLILRPMQKVYGKVKLLNADVAVMKEAFVNRDLVTVEDSLDKIEADLEGVRKSRDENLSWMSKVGFFKGYYEDSEHFINAGFHGIGAGREAVVLIKPFADAAGLRVSEEQEVVEKSLVEAFSNWVAVMPQVAADSDKIIEVLGLAGGELAKVDASRYPASIRGKEIRPNIERMQSVLLQLNDAAPDIKRALTIIPGLLGVNTTEKRYMIIMQNDKEIRPTGGFWTNYATFKINNAMLTSDFTSKDMYSIDYILDSIDAYYDFPDAPAPYTKYLLVEHWYARDTNSSPDFPTSLDNFFYFYNIAQNINPIEIKPVDGVFAIDTQVIAELMEVTGPVTVNGVTYTSENVVLELEKIASLALQEQVGRKRVLGYLMEAMLVNVFESDKNLWPKLIEKGVDLARRKHVLVYSFDPEAQTLLEKYDLGGRIKDPVEGDYSMVVSTNLGGDKTNWFVSKTINHSLSQDNGRWMREVKITYNYPQPDSDHAVFAKRFKDWVRVYAPEGSELISVEGSADDFEDTVERGKIYFDGWVEMGPGENAVMTFKYYLPDSVVGADKYNLLIQKQPGINGETHTVTVNGKTQEVELQMDKEVTFDL